MSLSTPNSLNLRARLDPMFFVALQDRNDKIQYRKEQIIIILAFIHLVRAPAAISNGIKRKNLESVSKGMGEGTKAIFTLVKSVLKEVYPNL